MEINYLIHHTVAIETANKALAKGLNPEGSLYRQINDPRFLPTAGREDYWFSMVIDPTDGYVLYGTWITDSAAMERFINSPESTIEL